MIFKDRIDAGRQLALRLAEFKNQPDVLVVGLLRGGIIVAQEIAKELHVPFDGIVVRKIGAPLYPEFAIGALAPDGTLVLNTKTMMQMGITHEELEPIIIEERKELARREAVYRKNRPYIFDHKTILLVDDGIATGFTMRAAIQFVKKQKVNKLVVAIPVLPPVTLTDLKKLVDQVVYVHIEEYFTAISQSYISFEQVSDTEVIKILAD